MNLFKLSRIISLVSFFCVIISFYLLFFEKKSATTDELAIQLPADLSDQLDYSGINGLPDYSGSGKTGDVLLTTVGHSSGDSYSIVIECIKEF